MTKLSATSPAALTMVPLISGRDGNLRASKPKDGNAAYVWRMAALSLSSDRRMQCMPMTADFGVTVPEDWKVEAPADWLAEQIKRTHERDSDVRYCLEKAGSIEAYHLGWWKQAARRRQYIKEVLDPIVDEIVKSVPVTEWHGVRRWRRALGG